MPSLPTPPGAGDSPGQTARHQTGLITIVFTDLVGSTALKQQVGDRTGASLIQQHHALVRDLLRGFPGGGEIETAGDSFLIVFTKPSDAVHFGLLLHARLRAMNQGAASRLEDRIGIHVGEVVIREQDGSVNPKGLTGIQVDTCARVMGIAQGGADIVDTLLLRQRAADAQGGRHGWGRRVGMAESRVVFVEGD
jgi:class 3 adenylate cyclase